MSERIGVGIITHKRPDYFKRVFATLPMFAIDDFIVVNDGTPYDFNIPNLIQNPTSLGVGKSKNIAFERLLQNENDHIFLIEDDILINDSTIFQRYIQASKVTGIQHFNYSQHGLMNKLPNSNTPNPRTIVEYNPDVKISLHKHCVGAFSYYTKKVLKEVGLIDDLFYNAFDHVEHTYRIIQKGMHPPFWWFADIVDSEKYLSDIPWTRETSTISSRPDHNVLVQKSFQEFQNKHKVPITSIPDVIFDGPSGVRTSLKNIFISNK